MRLADVGEVVDSVQDLRNAGISNGKPAVLVILYRQPGANIIETADRVREVLPQLQASIPQAIDLNVVMERTTTIRASLRDVERTLLISMGLVIVVVFVFLRNWRATLIPSVAVPVSLVGTFGAMYLCGYSLNNLSLMALTIATGFVVDDAIVVLENVSRYIEKGMTPYEAALRGVREVGFTVLSMSVSLIAVFIPILLMGGIVGRLLPGIRGHAVGRDPDFARLVADDDADDVRAPVEAAGGGRPRPPVPAQASACSRGFCAATRRRSAGRCAIRGSSCRYCSRRSVSMSFCTSTSRRAFSRSRIPGASSAASRPTRAFRSRPCAKSWRISSTSCKAIRRWKA